MELIEELAQFRHDPLGFVLYAFPWGEPGELEKYDGPEAWQTQILIWLGEGTLTIEDAIRIAVTSGHGIGKSALVAWIILWALSTFEDTIGVVTANTENQLKTKTWVQLAKWFRLFIGRDLFDMSATKICSKDPEHERTWRIDMVPWSERNTEAFAGLHNQGKRILVLFDEASAIPDLIFEVTEGALTDENTEIIWANFGNPTRNKGRFRDCFKGGKFAHRWRTMAVDSRSVSFTNKKQIEEWKSDYGEDSDFFRVRVRGVFPRVDSLSFIPYDVALEAAHRDAERSNDPVIIGVDVGRFGDDPTVIYPRCGRDAKSREPTLMYKTDLMSVAAKVANLFFSYHAAMVMVDGGGVGGGVVDRLRQLRIPVMEVNFSSAPEGGDPNDGAKYANKRAEIWGRMRTWLNTGAIPEIVKGNETSLVDELTGPTYGLNKKEEIQLEGKSDMRRRGIKSPNVADALACTFAFDFSTFAYDELPAVNAQARTPDYNPFEDRPQ